MLCVLLLGHAMGHAQGAVLPWDAQVQTYLQRQLTRTVHQGRLTVEAVALAAVPTLTRFYQRRAYQPAWSNDGILSAQVDDLLTALRAADQEGLLPSAYHLAEIETRQQTIRQHQEALRPVPPEQLGSLDLLLTDAFLTYSGHLWTGRVPPAGAQAAWGVRRPRKDFALLLQDALEMQGVTTTLQSLSPPLAAYRQLRQALADYRVRARAGGWPLVPSGPTLRPGDRDARVQVLRTRFDKAYDPQRSVAEADVFEVQLVQQVKHFQARHGLVSDGIVGPRTLAALNVPIERRIEQLLLNLERWRWVPRDLAQRAVLVNIAGFTLQVVEQGTAVLSMRIIVGKPSWRTPVFQSAITAVELSPAWNVPQSIAREELFPLIRRDPSYLTRHRLTVLQGSGARLRRVAPSTIRWEQFSARSVPYRLRQEPGPQNALGRLKFHLPNPFAVYLHDTPKQALFAQSVRAFSHGCIRLEKPLALATYALRDTPQWTEASLSEAIARGGRQIIRLPAPLPIYVGYWTAWVDAEGSLQWRDDLYGRDRQLQRQNKKPLGRLRRLGAVMVN